MIKYVKTHKPHRCRICKTKIPKGEVLSLGFEWFCGWECWNEYEAELQSNRKEAK